MAIAVAATVGLRAIGGAQWLEPRHHARRAHRWIAWTALAWAVALPLSFTPGPFVDETTPMPSQIALWGCAGVLMAYVMALIIPQGVRRLAQGEESHAAWRTTLTISGREPTRNGGPQYPVPRLT